MAYTTIDDPSAYFQTLLYTGNASQTALTNTGNSDLQPDWIWVMPRNNSGGYYNALQDTSRGIDKIMSSNQTTAERDTEAQIISVQSDGFTVGDNNESDGNNANYVNINSYNYVAWQWKANGGTTSSNTDGDITSTVQANTTAGFSIVTYTGTGSDASVGHGLGVAPKFYIIKSRNASNGWIVGHTALGTSTYPYNLILNSTNAKEGGSYDDYLTADPSSTVLNLGNAGNVNASSNTYVAYCFAEKQGYSKFGSFIGNNSSDGTFVYLGFTPRWLMVKNTTQSHANHSFIIFDSARETNNVIDTFLEADTNAADVTSGRNEVDFLSNGFKARQSYGDFNGGSGHTFVYMAFAEHPFVSSKGVPVTAR